METETITNFQCHFGNEDQMTIRTVHISPSVVELQVTFGVNDEYTLSATPLRIPREGAEYVEHLLWRLFSSTFRSEVSRETVPPLGSV